MEKQLSMFRFFKGEQENPFDQEKQNAAFLFWEYESTFELRYISGNFSQDTWTVPYAYDIAEWKTLFSQRPVNKEELFKLWLFNLLMLHLPDKYQTSKTDEFLRRYFDSK